MQCRNRYRPQDNDIEWWRNYVAEFFAPNGVVRVSVKDMPLFSQNQGNTTQPLTCTEVPYEVLPRLWQVCKMGKTSVAASCSLACCTS